MAYDGEDEYEKSFEVAMKRPVPSRIAKILARIIGIPYR